MPTSHAFVCEEFAMRKTPHRLHKAYSRNLLKGGPGIEVGIPARAGYGVIESFVKYVCRSPR